MVIKLKTNSNTGRFDDNFLITIRKKKENMVNRNDLNMDLGFKIRYIELNTFYYGY